MSTLSSVGESVSSYLGVIISFVFLFCIFIVVYYAEQNFPWHSHITCTIGYFAAFGILLTVPIDIADVIVNRRSADNIIGENGYYNTQEKDILNLYQVFFVIILIWGSAILVFEEYYNTAGQFTILSKILDSLKRFSIDTVLGVVAGLIILGILISQQVVTDNSDALLLAAVLVTNTIYETFLMILMAYGLIHTPRTMWCDNAMNPSGYLLKIENAAANEFQTISSAQLEMSIAVSDVLKTKESSNLSDPSIQNAISILQSECPPDFKSGRAGTAEVDKKTGKVTLACLARLRLRLNLLKHRYRMAQSKVELTKSTAYYLEDIIEAKKRFAETGNKSIKWTTTGLEGSSVEYECHVIYIPLLWRLLSVMCTCLSVFSFLGVICSMSGVPYSNSLYFIAVHDDRATLGSIAVFILLTLGYASYVTFAALFSVQIAGFFELVPHRTTPEALSFNVRMVARLAAPLAFFYLGWIAENGMDSGSWEYDNADQNTFMPSTFSKFYKIQAVTSIKVFFRTICPVILFVFLFLFITNTFNWLLLKAGLPQYQFGTAIATPEQLREGRRQLDRQKKRIERVVNRSMFNYLLKNVNGGNTSSDDGSRLLKTTLIGTVESNNNSELSKPSFAINIPASLCGLVERKVKGNAFGSSWSECYAEVRAPGNLFIFKDKTQSSDPRYASADYQPSDSNDKIELQYVIDFTTSPAPKGEAVLTIETIHSKVELKFKVAGDAKIWQQRLIEWKDFCIDSSPSSIYFDKKAAVTGVANPTASTPNPFYEKSMSTNSIMKDNVAINIVGSYDDDEVGDRPAPLTGWLEKKVPGKMIGGGWTKVYCRVNEATNNLEFFKSSDSVQNITGTSIDLTMVVDIVQKSGEELRFNVDLGDDKLIKFKTSSQTETRQWLQGLDNWRDYLLLKLAEA